MGSWSVSSGFVKLFQLNSFVPRAPSTYEYESPNEKLFPVSRRFSHLVCQWRIVSYIVSIFSQQKSNFLSTTGGTSFAIASGDNEVIKVTAIDARISGKREKKQYCNYYTLLTFAHIVLHLYCVSEGIGTILTENIFTALLHAIYVELVERSHSPDIWLTRTLLLPRFQFLGILLFFQLVLLSLLTPSSLLGCPLFVFLP